MRYALLGPGKRLRPCLTLAAAETVGARHHLSPAEARALALPAACAVEMVHTYSLVHDDLPAMDDDALRRGRPTTHIVHGDGMAILAGDGLVTDAFAVLTTAPSPAVPADSPVATAEHRLHAVRVLADAAGSRGMVGGQAIDLAAVGQAAGARPDAAALTDMHARKTGALIRAASTMGAIMAGAGSDEIDAIDRYAADLGLAFQIVDDVLDVEGSAADLGKTAGKDAAAGKPTFPALYGLDTSRRMAADCIARATATLDAAGLGGRLQEIAAWSLTRRA
ncbi:MAG: polyprenyl synthetase family protein [Acidobacteria bacterium]|nr:polyprenyl synthetase family protein [Acidobacteriota bacterium]